MPDVLGVFFEVVARAGRDRIAGVAEELVWLFVHTDHRNGRVVGAVVDLQHVLHPRDELAVGFGRDRPARFQVRTKPPFFRVRPIVE